MDIQNNGMTRRVWLQRAGALGLLAAMERLVPSSVWASASNGAAQSAPLSGTVIELTIAETPFRLDGRTAPAITINGTIPGPVIRLKEGQQVTLRVTNRLNEDTSITGTACSSPQTWTACPVSALPALSLAPPLRISFRFARAVAIGVIVTQAAKSSWASTRR